MKDRGKSSKVLSQPELNGGSPFPKSKLLDPGFAVEKDELLDRLYWSRQIIGLICGITWGCIPLVGAIWIAVFVMLSSAAIYGYYNVVLKIDEEEFNGHGTLLQEGMFTSIMLFLLSWILIYSLFHF